MINLFNNKIKKDFVITINDACFFLMVIILKIYQTLFKKWGILYKRY